MNSLKTYLFGEEDKAGEVDGKLGEHGGDGVHFEDVREGSLLAQRSQRL